MSLLVEHPPGCFTIRREVIEGLLGFQVRDARIYTEAFMHKSAMQLYGFQNSYERLEFLGDSVINFLTTKFAFDMYCDNVQEGFLTRIRTKVVSGKMLSKLALNLGLDKLVIMNHRALSAGWNRNPRILEDVFEALVGAIFLDLGLEACKMFFVPILSSMDFDSLAEETNYKDVLMRFCQSQSMDLPFYGYQISDDKMFVVNAIVDGKTYGSGKASSKREAEQLAALETIELLNIDAHELKRKS